ncbi:MAG: ankyrin repeat domain-containing protein [Planctomycetota bacterium]
MRTLFVTILLLMTSTVHAGELHDAIRAGENERVKALIEAGADVNAKDEFGVRPITLLNTSQQIKLVPVFLDAGANFDPRTRDAEVLVRAARLVDHSIASRLLVLQPLSNLSANVIRETIYSASRTSDATIVYEMLMLADDDGLHQFVADTALHAWKTRDLQVMLRLLHAGANPNAREARAVSILERAALNASPRAVEMLLVYGADPDTQTHDRKSLVAKVMHDAVVRHHFAYDRFYDAGDWQQLERARTNTAAQCQIVELLIRAGADLTELPQSQLSFMQAATQVGDERLVQIMEDEGLDPYETCTDGLTLAHHAMCAQDVDVLRWVELMGLSLTEDSNPHRISPLHVAIRMSNVDAADACIRAGARLDDELNSGQFRIYLRSTPAGSNSLHIAAAHGSDWMIRYCLGHGMDVSATTADGETPLMIAERMERSEIAEMLMAKGRTTTSRENAIKDPVQNTNDQAQHVLTIQPSPGHAHTVHHHPVVPHFHRPCQRPAQCSWQRGLCHVAGTHRCRRGSRSARPTESARTHHGGATWRFHVV